MIDVSVGVHPGMTTLPHLQTMTVAGPMHVTGVSDTPSRRKILTCTPATPARGDGRARQRSSPRSARQAFRRPPTSDDIES